MSVPTTHDAKVNAQSTVSIPSLTGRLAAGIDRLPPGDVAALRRMRGGDVPPPAFWTLAAQVLEPAGVLPGSADRRDEAEVRWATVISSLAENRGKHDPSRRMGRVLATAMSEMRFLKLVRARGEALLEAMRTTSHVLASKGLAADWSQLAALVLLPQNSDGAERLRRSLARDFYAQQPKATKE